MSPETARSQLQAAGAAAGAPPTDLARTVLTARRHRRRRTAAVGGAVLAVLLVVVGLPAALTGLQAPPSSSVAAGAGRIYTLPTRGSLAADQTLVLGLRQLAWAPAKSAASSTYRAYDAGNPVASSTYYVPIDLAAAVPADQRQVVWVDDIPGGRWALVAIPTDDGYAAAWFVGPTGASADQMSISGPVQLVGDDEPMAHVDLTNPDKTLVVVAAPGATFTICDHVTVQADGSTVQEFRELAAHDGVAVTTLDTPVRYGVPATVHVTSSAGDWQGQPTAAGQTSGVPWGSSLGYADGDPETPSIQLTRDMSGLDVGRVLSDTMLASVLGPTGLTLQDIDDNGPQITEIFSGTRDGNLPDPFSGDAADEQASQAPIVDPSIAIWDVRLPSGAHAVIAGWAVVEDPATAQGSDHQQTLLTTRGPDFDPAVDLIANRMDLPAADGRPAESVVVIAGDPAGATARLLDASGNEVGRAPLRDGTAVTPDPDSTVARVETLDRAGATLQTAPLSSGLTPLAPDSYPLTYLDAPLTPASSTSSSSPAAGPASADTSVPQESLPPDAAAEGYGQGMADCLLPLGFDVTVDPGGESYSYDESLQGDQGFAEAIDLCNQQTGYR